VSLQSSTNKIPVYRNMSFIYIWNMYRLLEPLVWSRRWNGKACGWL